MLDPNLQLRWLQRQGMRRFQELPGYVRLALEYGLLRPVRGRPPDERPGAAALPVPAIPLWRSVHGRLVLAVRQLVQCHQRMLHGLFMYEWGLYVELRDGAAAVRRGEEPMLPRAHLSIWQLLPAPAASLRPAA
jgi:hypothetical protein